MENSEIARKALEIMDRDGWCKGTFTRLVGPESFYTVPGVVRAEQFDWWEGSHCGGGIWSLACGYDTWADEEWYIPLWEKICEMFPEEAARAENFFGGYDFAGEAFIHTALARVVRWNDHFATEADVRAVFEKLAVG